MTAMNTAPRARTTSHSSAAHSAANDTISTKILLCFTQTYPPARQLTQDTIARYPSIHGFHLLLYNAGITWYNSEPLYLIPAEWNLPETQTYKIGAVRYWISSPLTLDDAIALDCTPLFWLPDPAHKNKAIIIKTRAQLRRERFPQREPAT